MVKYKYVKIILTQKLPHLGIILYLCIKEKQTTEI
nr:MAG TPA: hypothetical protein [Caudoviricetes sp.]